MMIVSNRVLLYMALAVGGAVWLPSPCFAGANESQSASTPSEFNSLIGQPADIISSAYQFRADRKAEENPPESWLALMHFAKLPLNERLDIRVPAIRQALCGLLWEEIRPVQKLELTWSGDATRRPAPKELIVTTLNNKGSASSWWNNLIAVQQTVQPTVSADGKQYAYDLGSEVCGIVIAVAGAKTAADFDVPTVRALGPDRWKRMNVEVEWGFAESTAEQDFSGRIETYDGKVANVRPLDGDANTTVADVRRWRSRGKSAARRGITFSLLYVGSSRWRATQSFTSQQDDVARTIVTLWTRAGDFSFLAGDLENGPILAPEYGFFVRMTSPSSPSSAVITGPGQRNRRFPLLTSRMNSIAGEHALRGWSGRDGMPWFGGNPTDRPITVQGIAFPAKSLAMHPAPERDVAIGWRSPIKGRVKISANLAHSQTGGNGIEWRLVRDTRANREVLAHGATDGAGSVAIPGADDATPLDGIAVEHDDVVSLVIGPKGDYSGDTNRVDLTIAEVGGSGRSWNLTHDVVDSIHANAHADGQGTPDVWHFYSVESPAMSARPPIKLASNAASAREFLRELRDRKMSTIREQTRRHSEQTWERAVGAMHGAVLPPHPAPPAEFEPTMQVRVPSERLTAQWRLGAWHLLRHAQRHPQNGRLWFNDFPYGILGAETYLILGTLDKIGSHQAAADGFDQWLSLPLDPKSTGHHAWALPDRPSGLFADGHGCLTHAVGPEGVGGQMDGIHAFGPGSIGWALTEHYGLTGDVKWLELSAPRIKANAEWMLRQRRLMTGVIPGSDRLWCKGLQPAQQVTPDSGGLWMQFYECEAYYWLSIARLATVLSTIDPEGGARLKAEAESYRKDLRTAVERSIALSPVVPVRDGTFHSVIPFACYVRGLSTGAWGWMRDGSGSHVGPLYWETVQSAAGLINPARLLPANDVRVQGYLDVLEDRLLLENPNVKERCNGDWLSAGWQYQSGLERTANMHLAGDDIPVFLRSFLNGCAVELLPKDGFIFNEHTVHGPPDKIFEEAAFLDRFRNLLVMEDGENLWLARGTPRAWLEQGQKISVKNAPTHFGAVAYEIISDADHGKITATINLPSRKPAKEVWLRLRHPKSAPIKSVTVNGKDWKDFDSTKEIVKLYDLNGSVNIDIIYQTSLK